MKLQTAFAGVGILLSAAIYACADRNESTTSNAHTESLSVAGGLHAEQARFERDGDHWSARGLPRGLSANVSDSTLHLSNRSGEASALRMSRIDGVDASRAEPTIDSNARLSIDRGAVVEMFETRADGVEQSFVVRRASPGRDVVDVDVEWKSDLTLAPSTRPNEVVLRHSNASEPSFHYGRLTAFDATNAELPAELSILDATHVRISVNTKGASFPIVIDPLVWAEEAKLVGLTAAGSDQAGSSVAISGDTILVGEDDHANQKGAAAIYVRKGRTWTEQQFLDFSDAGALTNQGSSVAIDGDTAVVGANTQSGAGAAYVYVRSGTTWTLQAKLTSGLSGFDLFGSGVAISGDTLAVSAPQDTSAGPGATYVYTRTGTTWNLQNVIRIDFADAGPTEIKVGIHIAMSGNTIVETNTSFTASGNLYVFGINGSSWSLEGVIPPELSDSGVRAIFASVAIDGDDVLAGSVNADATYYFHRTGTTWALAQKIKGPAGSVTFGEATLKGNVAFISDIGSGAETVYRYAKSGTTWSLAETIQPADVSSASLFGGSLAMTNDTAVFGASGQANSRGAVYVYTLADDLGDPCSDAGVCHSGFCVDGVCCDNACGGGGGDDCLACNVAGHEGTCGAATPTVTCRKSIGECDVAENCDGTNTLCPADSVLANGTTCSTGTCFVGTCKASAAPPIVDAGATADAPAASDSGCSVSRASSGSTRGGWLLVFGVAVFGVWRRKRGAPGRAALATCAALGGVVAIVACSTDHASHVIDNQPSSISAASFTATIREQGVDVDFRSNAVSISDPKNSARMTMKLASTGRGSTPHSVAPVTPTRRGARVSFAADGVTEWYETNPRGVEQGFDIAERVAGEGELELRVAIGGSLSPRLAPPGDHVDLVGEDGTAVFAYGRLSVVDARGRVVPASLAVADDAVLVHVDDRDAQYPLVVDPLVWRQHQKVIASDARPGSDFGVAVAVDHDQMIVGARNDDAADASSGNNQGAAYIFTRTGSAWTQQAKLEPSDPTPGALFGRAVAIAGDIAIVGGSAKNGSQGAVYSFKKTGTTWTQEAKLVASDPVNGDQYGHAVATDGTTLVIGANLKNPDAGAAYIYTRVADAWSFVIELSPDPVGSIAQFGANVALSGDTIVIGAPGADVSGFPSNPGAVYVYRGPSWNLESELTSVNGDLNDFAFGTSVAIQNDTVAIGTTQNSPLDGGVATGGSIYVFQRSGTTWTQSQFLHTSDEVFSDQVGTWVALDGTKLLVSAVGGNAGRGAAYLFESTASVFTQTNRFVANDANADDEYGFGVALIDDMALIGAYGNAKNAGAVYTVFLGSEGGPCSNGDPCATGFCVDGVCCDTACGGGDPNDCIACSAAAGAKVDGTCGPASPRVCRAATSDCDVAESCDGTNVVCPADSVSQNGVSCSKGTCSGGKCLAVITSNAPAPDAGVGPNAAAPTSDSGCGCRAIPSRRNDGLMLAAFASLGILVLRRRRRR